MINTAHARTQTVATKFTNVYLETRVLGTRRGLQASRIQGIFLFLCQ